MSDFRIRGELERNEVEGYHCQPIQKVETLEEAKARIKQYQAMVKGLVWKLIGMKRLSGLIV